MTLEAVLEYNLVWGKQLPFWILAIVWILLLSDIPTALHILIESHLAFDLLYDFDIGEHTDRQIFRAGLSVCSGMSILSPKLKVIIMAFCQNLD